MLIDYKLGQTSIILRIKILNSSVSTGAGLTGLTSASSGLIISTIADNEATPTTYTVAGSTIESITTLGTFATPTATKCRFKEVDATNHKGIYEIQLDNTRYAVSSAKSLLVSISGATNAAETDAVIPLRSIDPYDAVRAGLTALPNANAAASGGLLTFGTSTGQINPSSGKVPATLASTDVTGNVAADLQTIKTQAVTCAAGVTVNVNVGTTQPTNFTGTGASALVKTDMVDIAGAAVSTSTAQLGVNVVNFGGSAGTFASGRPEVNTSHIAGSAVSTSAAQIGVNVVNAGGTAWGSGAITRSAFSADSGFQNIRANTAQAGGSTTITLDASAHASNSYYVNDLIYITGGTGIGQARFITAYDGTTKVATVNSAWTVNPDATSTFAILPFDSIPGATAPTAAQVATAVWTDLLASSDFSTVSSIGKLLKDDIDTNIGSRGTGTALDAAGVRSAVGLASANLDTQLAALPTASSNASAVWGAVTRTLTAGTNIALAKGTGITGFNDLDAAGVRTAVGLASANLDTQLGTLATSSSLSGLITTVGVAGAGLTGIPKTGYKLASDGIDAILIESGISAGSSLTDDSGSQLTSINARQAMALSISALSGVLAGAATTSATIKPAGLPTGNTRITATVDADGNRSALALKVPT